MKSLVEYILEERQTINKLPFSLDLFTKFINDAIVKEKYDESEYWNKIKDIVINSFGNNVWKWFYKWCEKYTEYKDNITIEEFYNSLCNIPTDRIKRVLGSGSNAIVIDQKDRIMKIYYGPKIKGTDEPFYRWCHENESKVFPKVYKIGKNWCTLEKLKINTPKCKLYMDIIDGNGPYNYISDINKGRKLKDTTKLSKDQLEVYNWCWEIKETMDKINSKYISYPGDLVINNIGERDNGEIVFFDV